MFLYLDTGAAGKVFRTKVDGSVADAVDKIKFARDWRNRRLAHRELPPLDGKPPKPLAKASRKHVEDALGSIRAAMNHVESHYEKSTTGYEYAIEPSGSVSALVHYLERGLQSQRREDRERKWHKDDTES